MATDSHGMGIPLPADSTKVHQFPGVTRLAMERVAEILAGDLTAEQKAAVAAEADAAVAAEMAEEIAAGRMVEGGKTADPDIAFAVVDEDGRRTWLEADAAGKPTPRSSDLMAPALAGPVGASLGLTDQPTAITELGFAVVDEDGRRTELEVDAAGKFTTRVVDSLRTRITGGGAASNVIVCSGDSMTGGASGTPYPSHLATLTGWNVVNMGVGGETSTTIAGRMGGRPMLAMPASKTIPASGGVVVTLTSDDGIAAPTPLLQQAAGVNPVRIAGVEGTLTVDKTPTPPVYTFTRTTNGAAVAVNYPAAVSTQAMRDYRGGIHVMWWGTNPETGTATDTNGPDVIARQRALIDHMTDLTKRFIVMAPTIQTTAWRAALTKDYRRTYGRRFIDLGAYLSSPAAMEDAGLTPTQADLDAQALGKVPPALLNDPTHLNQAGDLLVAKQVRNRIQEMGWL